MDFREVTLDNLNSVIDLSVKPGQKTQVADNLYSIAQVGLHPSAWCRAAYVDDAPVGFFSVIEKQDENKAYIWRYMIDGKQQGKGYGRQMMETLLSQLFAKPYVDLVDLTVIRRPGGAEPFYVKCGFRATEEKIGNEWRMVMDREEYREKR